MNLTLYKTKSTNNTLSKELTTIKSVTFKFKDNASIITPKIELLYDESYINANYVYVPYFNRYYYITNKTVEPGARIVIDCKCDVLMSFKDDILKCSGIVKKNQNKYNLYLPNDIKKDVRRRNKAITFSDNWFNKEPQIVLITGC